MEIYARARAFMAKTGNPNQWGPANWPPRALIENDIKTGHSYVCVNGEGAVTGVFFYTQGENAEPTYREITGGSWLEDGPYGVVHRIAADGAGKGVGTFCLNWAFAQCGRLRIDTHADNTVMQNLLTKLGFQKRGIVYVREDRDPRFAYEKVKENEDETRTDDRSL